MWDTLSEKFTAPASYDRRVWVAALLSFLIGFLLLPLAAFFLPEKYRFLRGILAAAGPVAGALLLIIAMFLCTGSIRAMLEALDMHRIPRMFIFAALPLALGITICGGCITLIWRNIAAHYGWVFDTPATEEIALHGSNLQVVWLTVSALLTAPFFEEVLFRKAIFEFSCRWCGWIAALLIAPLVFSAMHASLLQLPGLFFMALVWQLIYLFTRNLALTMVLHFCNNLFAVTALLASRYGGSLGQITEF